MSINRGKIVSDRLDVLKITNSDLAPLIGMHRNWLGDLLKREDLDFVTILKIERAKGIDFSDEIPDLKRMRLDGRDNLIMMEPAPEYKKMTRDELVDTLLDLTGKYFTLQEKYTLLLEKDK